MVTTYRVVSSARMTDDQTIDPDLLFADSPAKKSVQERDLPRLLEYFKSGLSMPEFARQNRIADHIVKYLLKKHGLSSRILNKKQMRRLRQNQTVRSLCKEAVQCECGRIIKVPCLPCSQLRKKTK